MRARPETTRFVALFALGVAALPLVGAVLWLLPDGSGALGLRLAATVACLAALAVGPGLVEAAAARRTGQRAYVLSWLPVALGVGALAGVSIAVGPRGPDSGLADALALAAYGVFVIVFALAVNLVAALALWRRPGPDDRG